MKLASAEGLASASKFSAEVKSLSISTFSLIFNIHLSCSVLFCFAVAVVIVVVGCVGGYGGGDVCGCECTCTHTCIPPLHSHIHYILQFLLTDSG